MSKPIILGWRFWKNPRILTLECEHESIASCPDIICSLSSKEASSLAIYKNAKGEETTIDRKRQLLFINLLRMVTAKKREIIIDRVIFCQQGIDIELFHNHNHQEQKEIIGHIERNVIEALSTRGVSIRFNRGQR